MVDSNFAIIQNDVISVEQTPENAIENDQYLTTNSIHGSEAAIDIVPDTDGTVALEYDQHLAVDEVFIANDSMDSVAEPTTIDK